MVAGGRPGGDGSSRDQVASFGVSMPYARGRQRRCWASDIMRVLLVTEATLGVGILGHLRLEQVLADASAAGAPLDVDVLHVPSPGWFSRQLARGVPGLRLADADFQQIRWHLVHSWLARRALKRRMRDDPDYEAVILHTQSVVFGLRRWRPRRIPVLVSTDVSTRQWRTFGLWRGRGLGTGVSLWLTERSERRGLASADHVLAWSRWTAEGVSAAGIRVSTWHPGIERRWLGPVVPKPADPPLVLFVGGRFVAKGGPEFVEAVLPLVVAGEVEAHVVTTETIAPTPGLSVSALGPEDPELLALYDRAAALVLPSRGEAVPWVVIEALSRGCAVLAADVGAVAEMVGEGGWVTMLRSAEDLSRELRSMLCRPRRAGPGNASTASGPLSPWSGSSRTRRPGSTARPTDGPR
jgi:glycosyltransferase involved in cell wall biosynthesis